MEVLLTLYSLFAMLGMSSSKGNPPRLVSQCPDETGGAATIRMVTDVPAFALAKCHNGDRPFVSRDSNDYNLIAVLEERSDIGHCQFVRQGEGHVFTLDVEIGWGDEDHNMVTHKRIHTLSCVYDAHGIAVSFSETLIDRPVEGGEERLLVKPTATEAFFELSVIDLLDEEVLTDKIYLGKKIRLRVLGRSNSVRAFRAVSCIAKNGVVTYPILKAGCGDGHIFKATSGFRSLGNEVLSPYFESFQLKGGDTLQFLCNFTTCPATCDGDSCLWEMRRRQRMSPEEREHEDSSCEQPDPSLLVKSDEQDRDPFYG